ncbi:hypothetical protein CJF31_00003125 [Rutstroemia sp. NJR-2017a BVV2]|nr:hypothetical protein CJF31_00001917 [Rutstroemia sp. NJR-2017a BVV2]PQE18485.1 hypothetical protein CJF31_00003125 [Rutstroemia sp. NJR-2017a BVV2]
MAATIFQLPPLNAEVDRRLQTGSQALQILDSYTEIDFAVLFSSSLSVSDTVGETPRRTNGEISRSCSTTFIEPGSAFNVSLSTSATCGDATIEFNLYASTKLNSNLPLTPKTSLPDTPNGSLTLSPGTKHRDSSDSLSGRNRSSQTHESHKKTSNRVRSNLAVCIPPLGCKREKYPSVSPTTKVLNHDFKEIESLRVDSFLAQSFNKALDLTSTDDDDYHSFEVKEHTPVTPRKYEHPNAYRLVESHAKRTPRPTEPLLNQATIMQRLRYWTKDRPDYVNRCMEKERRNPFAHLRMNEGWTRARCQGELYFEEMSSRQSGEVDGRLQERIRVRESLARFTFWEQLEPMVMDGAMMNGGFGKVFLGAQQKGGRTSDGYRWKRAPGAWWARRKRLFDGKRGKDFGEWVWLKTWNIRDRVAIWAEENEWKEDNTLKRKWGLFQRQSGNADDTEQHTDYPAKRVQVGRTALKPIDEKWRARRREQEKRAGRWTDGTLRMYRLWDGFHWVLDAKDHRDRRFFNTRDWTRKFELVGLYDVSVSQIWAEFSRGWGPLQSWLFRNQLADYRYPKWYQATRCRYKFLDGMMRSRGVRY